MPMRKASNVPMAVSSKNELFTLLGISSVTSGDNDSESDS